MQGHCYVLVVLGKLILKGHSVLLCVTRGRTYIFLTAVTSNFARDTGNGKSQFLTKVLQTGSIILNLSSGFVLKQIGTC